MDVVGLIKKLNKMQVTYVLPTGTKVMTLADRLADTCEAGFLISGEDLNDVDLSDGQDTLADSLREYLADTKLPYFDPNTVYCWSPVELYRVGKDYQECVQELNQGAVSQLSDTSDSTWVTIMGNHPKAKLNDEFVVVGLK